MAKIDFDKILKKYKTLIEEAKSMMSGNCDAEHSLGHILDVYEFCKQILNREQFDVNVEALLLSVFWHDVGRTIQNDGHEKISADMLKARLTKENFDKEFIDCCYLAIVNHKWSMTPTTLEGVILRDADKLAFLGKERWEKCVAKEQRLDSIVELLPTLRNDLLKLDVSRQIYDEAIVDLFKLLYDKVF